MNCKWAEKWELENARETTVWLCKSPKREDVACGFCCLACHFWSSSGSPMVESCRGVCSTAWPILWREVRHLFGYWDATGHGRWVPCIEGNRE